MNLTSKFSFDQPVCLINDEQKKICLVTGILFYPNGVKYELLNAYTSFWAYESQLQSL